jgi:thiol-disulfide isomerase/thioredoxin
MQKFTALSLGLLAVMATGCVKDSDKDGLTNEEEEAFGTDPKNADTDGDGLSDFDEVNGITDPLDADTDGDGLSDFDEVNGVTDPLDADSDGDGHSDGDELAAETDPNVCWSVPSGYPDCTRLGDAHEPEGWALNKVAPAFPMNDQNSEDLLSSRFYGMILVMDISAGWCGPCRAAAPGMETIYQKYKADGVMPIQIMIDDNSNDGVISDPEGFKQSWAGEYDLTFPVTSDSGYEYEGNYFNTFYAEMSIAGLYTGYIPFFAVLDREHRVVAAGVSEEELDAIIDGLL